MTKKDLKNLDVEALINQHPVVDALENESEDVVWDEAFEKMLELHLKARAYAPEEEDEPTTDI